MKSAKLIIDLDSILYNYRHLKCYYQKNVIAVLKDDAYGVGLIKVMKTLKHENGLIIAINKIEDIILLRENGYDKDILYLNVFDKEDITIFKKYNVSVIVQSIKQLEEIEKTNIPFHLKFNTGMNRLGVYDNEVNKIINMVNNNKDLNLIGVMTHFANDDNEHTCYKKFENIVRKIKKDNLIIHCFASSSLNEKFDNISTHIRVGIKLYGIGERNTFLHNAITLKAPIIEIKPIDENQKIGYDFTYTTSKKGYLYILPIGYGQGFGRFKKSLAYVNNTYLKQAGHISMDYSTYFSTSLINIDQEVELLGKKVSFEEISLLNNIDPHEILVRLKIDKIYFKTY